MSSKQRVFIYALILLVPILYFGGDCSCFESAGNGAGLLAGLGAGRAGLTAAVNLREQIIYVGNLPGAAKEKPIAVLEMQSLATRAQGILFFGTIRIRGKITAQTVGAPLPRRMRLQLRLKRAGRVLFTEFWDFNVLANGNIPGQNLVITQFSVVNLRDIIQFSILPLDIGAPPTRANITLTYTAPTSSQAILDEPEEEIVEAAALVQRFQISFTGVLGRAPNNVVAGAINLKAVRGPLLTWNGNLNVRGKLTPSPSGPAVPSTIQLGVKHKRFNGSVLRTENFTINVQPNGTIALQSFPITTINAANIKEALELSITPVGRNFPNCNANLALFYTPLPGT